MQRACSIFFYDGYVSLAPTVISLSEVLEQQGYSVTIYATYTNTPQPKSLGKDIKIFYFSKKIKLLDSINKPVVGNFLTISRVLKFASQCLKEKNHSEVEQVNIGVDLYGSVAALFRFYVFKQKFLFLSLELENPEAKFKRFSQFFVNILNLAYRKAEAVIIQDEERYKTLIEYCHYQHEKVFYLPNSPLSSPETLNSGGNENFFREKLNLNSEKFPYLILSAGMICESVCSTVLARAFAKVDNGCALIFHGVVREPNEAAYLNSLKQANADNLFLSLDLVLYEQIDRIYQAATIGLAFYDNCDDNFSKIAMASGKLPQYLKHGKPVLVSNLPSLSRLVEQYNIGIVIKDPSDSEEIQSALEKLLSSYETYSQNAQLCFEAEFDFAKKMQPLLGFMDKLCENPASAKN